MTVYSNLPPLIQDDSDEEDYSDMPPLIPVEEEEEEEDYLDMPPLVPAAPIQNPLYDQFVNSLQIGDTFKAPGNYHMIYRGKCDEIEDLYHVDIVNIATDKVDHSYYSKFGIYVSLFSYEKVQPSG